jgi:16S rRNA G966 N2-methylase RsmD
LTIEPLTPEARAFILSHEDDDIEDLLLRQQVIGGMPSAIIARQIKGRKKAKVKLPSFYRNQNVVYPQSLNIEQSSSEQTAEFKSALLARLLPEIMRRNGVDLTGGLGVDTLYLSRCFETFHYVEPDPELFEITAHNLRELRAANVRRHNTSADAFLTSTKENFDLVYVDPSRRIANRKVFTLAECEPDIIRMQDEIFARSSNLLVKASPLLDIRQGLRDLRFVKMVLVLALENECKELLFYAHRDFTGEPEIAAINIEGGKESKFSFTFSEETNAPLNLSPPSGFIFEPNASILKAGAFKLAGNRFGLQKIHPNTHLYSSPHEIADFPGRIFRSLSPMKADPKEVEKHFPDRKANVILRNYPLAVEELKKKLRLNDGGDKYLLGFTAETGKLLIVAERLR